MTEPTSNVTADAPAADDATTVAAIVEQALDEARLATVDVVAATFLVPAEHIDVPAHPELHDPDTAVYSPWDGRQPIRLPPEPGHYVAIAGRPFGLFGAAGRRPYLKTLTTGTNRVAFGERIDRPSQLAAALRRPPPQPPSHRRDLDAAIIIILGACTGVWCLIKLLGWALTTPDQRPLLRDELRWPPLLIGVGIALLTVGLVHIDQAWRWFHRRRGGRR